MDLCIGNYFRITSERRKKKQNQKGEETSFFEIFFLRGLIVAAEEIRLGICLVALILRRKIRACGCVFMCVRV